MNATDRDQIDKLRQAIQALEMQRAVLGDGVVREFIVPRGESAFAGTAEYIFKHALLREVTYEMVLKRVRGQYHALVTDWLAAAAESNGRLQRGYRAQKEPVAGHDPQRSPRNLFAVAGR